MTLGFHLKPLGTMSSEKVLEVHFSGAGNILCTIDQDGQSKTSLNFICKVSLWNFFLI